jgi:hypothetical protein
VHEKGFFRKGAASLRQAGMLRHYKDATSEVMFMRVFKVLGFLLIAGILLSMPAASHAQIAVGVAIRVGPPVIPVYAQPVCPGAGYIWTPGYWAHGEEDYYWVPGTWVLAPEPGLLWTPGYWGFAGGVYAWHAGYWGPHVGFYGGINYGYGYTGVGFWGGEWRGREFVYNRAVSNVNVTIIHNTYNRTVVVNNVNRVSFNGGPHGIQARETERERIAEHEHHFEARREQVEHEHAAHADRSQWASVNHGRPSIAASGRPGEFHGHDVVPARAEHGDRPDNAHRADRPADHRNDRPTTAAASNRNDHRNDRPSNAMNHENAGRPNANPSNSMRDAREVHPVPNNSKGPQGEARGNPHVDHSAPQHASAPHDNGQSKDRGKAEHGKPEKP